MAKISSGLFMLLVAALITATIAGPAVSAGQITSTRSMPSSAAPGETFTVTLTINVDENNPPSALTINERVPSGLTVGEANPQFFNNAGGSLLWIITPSQSGGKISDQSITYTLSGSTPGAYAFNGNVYAGNNYASTEGSITVKIKEPCTENWTCGEWSACQNGAQQRVCTDTNSCPLPESRPAMSQSCTATAATNPSPEDQDNPSGGTSGNAASANSPAGNGTTNATSNDTTSDESALNQPAPDNVVSPETSDDSQENTAPQPAEEKENKTAEEKITGKALDSSASQNAKDSAYTESADNSTSEKSTPQGNNNNIPVATLVLATILVAVIAIFCMKKLNLIGTS